MSDGDGDGRLPKGWTAAPLLDLLASLESGKRPRGGVRGISGGVASVGGEHLTYQGAFDFTNPKYVPSDFAQKMRRGHIRRGDVLIVKDGATTGKTALVDRAFPFDQAVANEHLFVCRPVDAISATYLAAFLRSPEGQGRLLSHFQGSAQGGINQSFATGTRVPVPPMAEQQRIVDRLQDIDGLRASVATRLATARTSIKRYRIAILAAACSGRLTNDWREDHDAPPWRADAARNVCAKVQSGTTPKEWHQGAGGVPFLKVYNIVDQRIDFSSRPQFIAPTLHRGAMRRATALPGDVLMNIVGPPLGKVAVVSDQYPEWSINQALALFRPSALVTTGWLYLFLRSGISVATVVNQTRGTAGQTNISLTQCRDFEIPVPSTGEQQEIVRRADASLTAADELEEALNRAEETIEQALRIAVAKAFRGELVPNEARLATEEEREYETAEELLKRVASNGTSQRQT